MVKEFKTFLFRGNMLDLAVAVVIGAAFGAVIAALVKDLITPVISALVGKPDFSGLTFTINNSVFRYGDFFNALLSFVLIAAAVFFFVIVPMNRLVARSRRQPPPDPTTQKCPECLSQIPVGASRCAYCTAQLAGSAAR